MTLATDSEGIRSKNSLKSARLISFLEDDITPTPSLKSVVSLPEGDKQLVHWAKDVELV